MKHIQEDFNIIGGQVMLILETFKTPKETPKVRYIANDHWNTEVLLLAHDVSKLR